MTEAQLQDAVLKLAKIYNYLAYHTHDSRKSQRGFLDLTLVRPPRVIFAELKGDGPYGNRGPTPAQLDWIEALEQCPGVEVYVWYPHDINEIATILARRTQHAPGADD